MADTERPDEEMPAAGGAENPNEKNPTENGAGAKNEATVIEIRDGAPSEKADGGRAKSTADGAADKGADVREDDLRYRSGGQVAKSGLLGAFIGLAIIVPGVSGSAVAIIFRLYEKLLYALGNFFRKFKRCALFLLPVAVGAAVGLILGFFGVRALLGVMPFATVALFAGLMLGAYPAVTDQLKGEKLTPWRGALFALGLALPVALSAVSVFAAPGAAPLENLQVWHYLLFLLLGWLVALTQLVPGLSATALLMTVGYFTPLLDSVSLTYWQSRIRVPDRRFYCGTSDDIKTPLPPPCAAQSARLLRGGGAVARLRRDDVLQPRDHGSVPRLGGRRHGSRPRRRHRAVRHRDRRRLSPRAMRAQACEVNGCVALFVIGIAAAFLLVRCERRNTR